MKLELKLDKPCPTALVFVQMETFSQSSKMARIVGTSFFPLFINANDEMPVTVDSAKKITPHIGLYQMPLYHKRVNE